MGSLVPLLRRAEVPVGHPWAVDFMGHTLNHKQWWDIGPGMQNRRECLLVLFEAWKARSCENKENIEVLISNSWEPPQCGACFGGDDIGGQERSLLSPSLHLLRDRFQWRSLLSTSLVRTLKGYKLPYRQFA